MGTALRQIWTMCLIFLNLLTCGYHLGYSTILLRDVKTPDSEIQLSLEAESWVVSAAATSTLPALLMVVPTVQILGRKPAQISMILPNLFACVVMYFARDFTALLIARLLCGLTFGSTIAVTAIIIGEYSSPEYRGIFLNAKTASSTLGVLIVHSIGIFFNWKTTILIGLIPSVLSLLITLTWTEIPAWLAYKGRYEDCKTSFLWLRGDSQKAKEELQLLMQTQRNRRLSKVETSSSIKQNILKLKRKDFQKPSLIAFFLFIILEACGRHTFSAYAISFMSAFTSNKPSTLYYVLAIEAINFLSSLFSCLVVKLFRRRLILFTSGGLACGLLLCICIYLCLKSQGLVPEKNVWFPLSIFILYSVIINGGVAPTTKSLLGEIYPLEHKGLGTVMSGIFFSLTFLISLEATPALIKEIDVYGTFFVYLLLMAGSLLYLYFTLPETEGKTLQEIEHYFNGVPITLQKENENKLIDSPAHEIF